MFSVSTYQDIKRECDDPPPEPGGLDCLGPPIQLTEDDLCFSTCPDDCPDGKWGLNCTSDCSQCESPCDKKKGICHSCKPGYRLPLFSCSKMCDKYFYGFDCRGNCVFECEGDDCIDRVKGTCPAKQLLKLWHLLGLLLLIPMAILCYLPQKYKRQYVEVTEDDEVDDVDRDSGMGVKSGMDNNLITESLQEKQSLNLPDPTVNSEADIGDPV
ncbi:hypothetical protein Btru_042481 [Bulinus truncatus]|nr:hypothetical protein Btru_042481 [Bulinus truncatus]